MKLQQEISALESFTFEIEDIDGQDNLLSWCSSSTSTSSCSSCSTSSCCSCTSSSCSSTSFTDAVVA